MARRDEVTPDGFALVLCHELAHAYGGFPYIWPTSQMSAEGQADYYGAKNCLKEIFNKLNPSEMIFQPTSIMEERCADNNSVSQEESKRCLRGLSAGKSIATLLATIKDQIIPTYLTPDDLVVDVTALSYPETVQCRLDTYLAANIDLERPCCWFKGTEEESCFEVNKLGPFLKTVAWQLNDSSGNADEMIQPGEEVKLSIVLKNIGRKSAENVQIKISSSNDNIQLENEQFSFVGLGPDEEVTMDNIKLAISPMMDCGSEFALNLEISYGDYRREVIKTYKIGQQHFQTVSFESDEGVEIPDNDSSGISTELFVPFGVADKKVTIPINLSHTYVGDLKITLTDPVGNQVILIDRNGYNNDDIIGTFGKDLEVQGDLDSFQADMPGTWVLHISDHANLDSGTLNEWGIEVEHFTCE